MYFDSAKIETTAEIEVEETRRDIQFTKVNSEEFLKGCVWRKCFVRFVAWKIVDIPWLSDQISIVKTRADSPES